MFKDSDVEKYKKYAAAFFPGAEICVIKEGAQIPGTARKIPKNFLEDAGVTWRNRDDIEQGWYQYSTHGKNGLLQTLPRYRPTDSYAMIGLTNEDLYPSASWNFCFGWATYNVGVGAFSFCRYDPEFDGIDDPNRDTNLLMRSCAIMAHEMCHMFAMKHCIYYECLMNGLNSAEEQRQGGIRTLCPVCLKKLKSNLKFDVKERYEKLLAVCNELGLHEEAKVYAAILAAGEATPKYPFAREKDRSVSSSRINATQVASGSSRRNVSAKPRFSSSTRVNSDVSPRPFLKKGAGTALRTSAKPPAPVN